MNFGPDTHPNPYDTTARQLDVSSSYAAIYGGETLPPIRQEETFTPNTLYYHIDLTTELKVFDSKNRKRRTLDVEYKNIKFPIPKKIVKNVDNKVYVHFKTFNSIFQKALKENPYKNDQVNNTSQTYSVEEIIKDKCTQLFGKVKNKVLGENYGLDPNTYLEIKKIACDSYGITTAYLSNNFTIPLEYLDLRVMSEDLLSPERLNTIISFKLT